MTRVNWYVCMRCQSGPAGHGTYFPTYKATACHHARRLRVAVTLVTSPILAFALSISSPDPVTGMLKALVPLVHDSQPVQTRWNQVSIHISPFAIKTPNITPCRCSITPFWCHITPIYWPGYIIEKKLRYIAENPPYGMTQKLVRRLYSPCT